MRNADGVDEQHRLWPCRQERIPLARDAVLDGSAGVCRNVMGEKEGECTDSREDGAGGEERSAHQRWVEVRLVPPTVCHFYSFFC